MSGLFEELVPPYVGKELLRLTAARLEPAQAFTLVDVDITALGEALVYGVGSLLELTITAPSPGGFERQLFTALPATVSFTPKEGGPHLLVMREVGHNLWWGRLVIDVRGDRLSLGS